MNKHLNSFQKWAKGRTEPLGFTVEPCGNWVKLIKGGEAHECWSVFGVASVAGFELNLPRRT